MPDNCKLRVFLCHASQDKPIVRELYQRLLVEGWIDPWLDEEKLLSGQDWDMEIEKAVETTDAVIVCLSNNSVSKEGYVQRELRFVLGIADYKPEGTIFIIPIRLDDSVIPRRLRMYQHADLFPKERREATYKRILKSLEQCYDTLHAEKVNRKNDALEENPFVQLTQQELYVLMFMSEGMTNRDIAKVLFLKDGTVRNYVSSIFSKLGVSNRAEAAVFAVENNLKKYVQ